MSVRRWKVYLGFVAVLSACGGGGGSGGTSTTPPPTAGTPTPTPPSSTCSLRARQDWAAAQLREWYLFPETLPSLNPANYATVNDFVDAMTATARQQGRDRFFTYVTSIAEENAFYEAGADAGFGFRLTLGAGNGLFVTEAFEGAPALAAGIDRGTEIVGIGTDASNIRAVSTILQGGSAALDEALGPPTAGVTRVLRIADATSTRVVTVTKAQYEIDPVSNRYGARILNDGGRQVGYLNLRTFISTADPALRSAFAQFRAAGVTDYIIDFRYNGGGLVSIAELMGDLLGANRSTSDVFSYTTFRPEKAAENDTRLFQPLPQSVAPTRVAFIGTGGTASASEMVINSFIPYLRGNLALVGTNTYGKPVGQIAIDRAQCDDRFRIVAFATQNSERRGNYFNGLANEVQATCRAPDDISTPLGDPREASIARALDFLAGRACLPISSSAVARRSAPLEPIEERTLLTPDRPTPAQRDVPGLY